MKKTVHRLESVFEVPAPRPLVAWNCAVNSGKEHSHVS